MRATVMYGAFDVRVEDVPDARLVEPTDALVVVTRAAICGSDLWPYKSMEPSATGRRMGHEFIGVVEAVGADVRTMKAGDLVVAPFVWSDGTCVFCREGLHTSCLHGGRYGADGVDGRQGEAVRVPQADGTLVVLPVDKDNALMPSLLTLTDVMATGHHAALSANVGPGKTVAVVGDGAVGLCGVLAARRLGAEQIILLGRHRDRIAIARDFGATDVVSERGDEAVDRVRELTDGFWRPLRARVRRAGTVDCYGVEDRSSGRSRWPSRRAAGGVDPGSGADVFRQRHHRRRACTGTRVHRGAAARGPRGHDRARSSLRPSRAARRRARRLPSDERARSDQGDIEF